MVAIIHLYFTLLSIVDVLFSSMDQRWLTLDALCSTLRLQPAHVRTLVRKGFLVAIGGGKGVPARYLEPTDEYKEQLRIAAILHMRAQPIPMGISEKCLLTAGEIGELLGSKSAAKTNKWLNKHKVVGYKVTKALSLYTVKDVREALWRREGRILAKQRAPYLISEIVEYVRRIHAAETALVPTDKEFRQDDILLKKLEVLAALGEDAQMDFAAKVELARKVVQLLESA